VQLVQGVVQWQVAQRPKCRQAAPTLRSKMPGCAEKKSGADEKAQHSHGRRCGRGAGLSAAGVTGAARRATRGKFAPSTPRSAAENAADANLSGARPSRHPCPIDARAHRGCRSARRPAILCTCTENGSPAVSPARSILRAIPMRPNEAKSRCLSTIRNQGRAEEYFERSLTVAPQQQQLC
jgi:hypothetical protein